MNLLVLYFLEFAVALAVLLKASDWFVDGAERIGLSFGISPFIIGVTIIAFGPSLPELASSIAAVNAGQSEIVIGNVVGSNIANIALIIGLVAIVGKDIHIQKEIMNIDMPLLAASALLLAFVIWDKTVDTGEIIVLLMGLFIFIAYSIKGEARKVEADMPKAGWKDYVQVAVAVLLVYLSAEYTIDGISKLSAGVGIPPNIIALTLVAVGTSLPELIVSIGAARKGKTDIAIGNVLGSNIFNAYTVTSLPALFGDLTIPDNILAFSMPFMLALTFLFAIFSINRHISRWEGWVFIMFYLFFVLQTLKDI